MEPLAHASIGLMAKSIAPKAPLWALLAATEVLDAVSIGLIAVGIERGATTQLDFEHGLQYLSQQSIPWSHGLFMSLVWSVVVAVIGYLLFRDRRTSILIGLLVFSHWVLDFIVYLNIPVLFDGSSMIGLGLITSRPGLLVGIILEIVLIVGGITIYWVTRKRTRVKARERHIKELNLS
jgi:prolipoprotein diacylglyceryltransferase